MVCSDLHLDINSKDLGRDLLSDFVEVVLENAPDLLLIAGDISNSSHTSLRVIDKIEETTGITVKFIPGNHDIWSTNETSDKAYDRFRNHHSTLIDNPYIINDQYAIVGDMGWYDYSFGPIHMSTDKFLLNKKMYWNDAVYVRFNKSDHELCGEILARLELQLKQHRDKKIIFMNHFIPFETFIQYKDSVWNICNAFMGSKKIGEMLDRHANIQYVIFGHTHTRFPMQFIGSKQMICKPLGYRHEWKIDNFRTELSKCITWITIQ